ncbi:glutamate-cysteine ligase family protein [Jatrophihabitans sp.]|jgi:glutamate--cysteine ligase|uniref:glutamate-cysteine ligase family protein n=1 Tax=Jatrophihabitans sp. TaxID=1932789 RepID=UPI002F0D64C7
MSTTTRPQPIRTIAEAGTYVTRVCFKHGPPVKTGIELEWLVIDPHDPDRRPDVQTLVTLLGPHAPATLAAGSPGVPLPRGGLVTVEPGGQLEISSLPYHSVTDLITAMTADIQALRGLLAPAGFELSGVAADPHRLPHRILRTPRYDAMADRFDQFGPAGRVMMCSTASTQICLDLGSGAEAADRWRAAHYLGPVLLAAFANSPRTAGELVPAAASTRMSSWWQLDPERTRPPASTVLEDYAERVVDTQVLARRRATGDWRVAQSLTLREWIDSGEQVTTADIDLHLSMLFPPVRPQGYLEIRYLDAQPGDEWIVPLALLAALFAGPHPVGEVLRGCAEGADRWQQATEQGLADPVLRSIAARLLDIAIPGLDGLGLPPAMREQVDRVLRRRLCEGVNPGSEIPLVEGRL